MRNMLSRQINLVYNQLNLQCDSKRTNNLWKFNGEIHERQNQSPAKLSLARNQLAAKIQLIIPGHFRLKKINLALYTMPSKFIFDFV